MNKREYNERNNKCRFTHFLETKHVRLRIYKIYVTYSIENWKQFNSRNFISNIGRRTFFFSTLEWKNNIFTSTLWHFHSFVSRTLDIFPLLDYLISDYKYILIYWKSFEGTPFHKHLSCQFNLGVSRRGLTSIIWKRKTYKFTLKKE